MSQLKSAVFNSNMVSFAALRLHLYCDFITRLHSQQMAQQNNLIDKMAVSHHNILNIGQQNNPKQKHNLNTNSDAPNSKRAKKSKCDNILWSLGTFINQRVMPFHIIQGQRQETVKHHCKEDTILGSAPHQQQQRKSADWLRSGTDLTRQSSNDTLTSLLSPHHPVLHNLRHRPHRTDTIR